MSSKYIPVSIKRLVEKRANSYCEYCYATANFSPSYFEFDHVMPSSVGGATTAENLALSCGKCNNRKSNLMEYIDPFTNELVKLFHPRKDLWTDHFTWSEDSTIVIGLTPSGRATTLLLQINRPSNVNLRRLLAKEGWHPPNSYPLD
ncbi:MAG: HNH endonuclease signature motif containing protein [Bacteroidota bacterium]